VQAVQLAQEKVANQRSCRRLERYMLNNNKLLLNSLEL